MSYKLVAGSLSFKAQNKDILNNLSFTIEPGQFVTILGENGAGKTTLLDLIMGFSKSTAGSISIADQNPYEDHWKLRQDICYLSEKVDIPADISVAEFLDFNRFFYKNYSKKIESELCKTFKMNKNLRIGNLSAGETRRAQIVGALSSEPKLIIVDEITAVLDIVGRRRFMDVLFHLVKEKKCTVVMATNILEDLESYISHLFLLSKGELILSKSLTDFRRTHENLSFSESIVKELDKDD